MARGAFPNIHALPPNRRTQALRRGGASGTPGFLRRNNSEGDPWDSTSLSVARIQINGFAVNSAGDYIPPALHSNGATVQNNGREIVIEFLEALDFSNGPPLSAFSVMADGRPVTVTAFRRVVSILAEIDVSPTIKDDQTVTVAYADPTTGDDAKALQDAAGNDVASFSVTATNHSAQVPTTPGVPTKLTATADGDTMVDLSWKAPVDTGGLAITGYRIEWRAADGSTWQDAVANTGSTATTRTVTVPSGQTTRRFRVSAINTQGTGDPSDVATGANTPATGRPTVSGSGRAGQMLTAATDGISDEDGLTGVTYEYRWFHLDGTTETAIAGAESDAYMPVPADLGTRIGVRVDFTDDGGFAETRASAAVTIRAAMPPATCPAANLGGRTQVWSGTVEVGGRSTTTARRSRMGFWGASAA